MALIRREAVWTARAAASIPLALVFVDRRVEILHLAILFGMHQFLVDLRTCLGGLFLAIRRNPLAGLLDGGVRVLCQLCRSGRLLRGRCTGLRESGSGSRGAHKSDSDHQVFHVGCPYELVVGLYLVA